MVEAMSDTAAADAMALLPVVPEAPRCADFSQNAGLAPGGTSIAVDTIVVIEVPLPWPKPMFGHPLLDGVKGKAELFGGAARVLAAVPRDPVNRKVYVWRRAGGSATATAYTPTNLPQFLADLDGTNPPTGAAMDPRAILICTQGSHDMCCGTLGQAEADALGQIADVPILQVSHTGGHRFAPTGMTLPDGRMWAYANAEEFLDAQNGRGNAAELAAKCRGWWGAAIGPAQAAEAAVFGQEGFGFNELDRSVAVRPNPSDEASPTGPWIVDVRAGDDAWTVEVTVDRMVPTISCLSPGGLPAKPAREFLARVLPQTV